MKAKKRYVVGLEKLAFAASQVAIMQKELEDLQPQLVVSAEENQRMMVVIEKESAEVEEISVKVRAEEAVANEQAASCQSQKDECEAELAEAIPALEAAIAALDTLKPADITIVKNFKNPPANVKLVLGAVCVMKDIKPDKINDPSGKPEKVTFDLDIISYRNLNLKHMLDLVFLGFSLDFGLLGPVKETSWRFQLFAQPESLRQRQHSSKFCSHKFVCSIFSAKAYLCVFPSLG